MYFTGCVYYNFIIRQWHVAFPLMCVGLYIAETPGIKCLTHIKGNAIERRYLTPALNKTPAYYHNVAHSNPFSCCGPRQLIFSSAKKQQGNSADCSKENALRYTCFVSNPCPWLEPLHRLFFYVALADRAHN